MPPKKPVVSIEEFSSLKGLVERMADVILAPKAVSTAETIGTTSVQPQLPLPPTETENAEASVDGNPLNPHWRRAVDVTLGKDFDAYAKYPLSGGCIFTVIVPKAKSNAPQLYWEMHKQDRRSREIGATGLEGVKKWCELIKKNLAGLQPTAN